MFMNRQAEIKQFLGGNLHEGISLHKGIYDKENMENNEERID